MAFFAPNGTQPAPTHVIQVGTVNFEVSVQYELIRPIGHGAYGVVISANDTTNNRQVAIKKIPNVFRDVVDGKRILREIKLLRQLRHENIIQVVDILPPQGTVAHWQDLYIITDLMETDLHRIIYSQQALSIDHIQYFIYQILRALKYMHSAGVVHRDLKPPNILLNANCDLKLCDLGLARGLDDQSELTEYVVTRWYRAPEIMLATQNYTQAIDVWSVGCIFSELVERRPLFPGDDYIDQLRRICDRLGRPQDEQLDFVTGSRARHFILSLPNTPQRPFSELYPTVTPAAADLLARMLAFSPHERITVDEALRHPFMETLHDEEDEPLANFTVDFQYEQEGLDQLQLREMIWEEMTYFHPTERHRRTLLDQDLGGMQHGSVHPVPFAQPPQSVFTHQLGATELPSH